MGESRGSHPQAAAETGLAAGTPVFGGTDDASPVAITTGCIDDGQCYLSIGSGSNVVTNTSVIMSHPTGILYPHCIPGLNMFVTVISSMGVVINGCGITLPRQKLPYHRLRGGPLSIP